MCYVSLTAYLISADGNDIKLLSCVLQVLFIVFKDIAQTFYSEYTYIISD